MPITKEEFCKIICNMEEQYKRSCDFSDALGKICDGYPVFDVNNKYLESLLFLLNKIFHQDPKSSNNAFEWYLFERNWSCPEDNTHMMYFENYCVNICNPELLYDSLIAEMESNEGNHFEPTRIFFKTYGKKNTEIEA